MSLKSGEKVNLLTLIQEIKSEEGKTDKTTTRQYPSDVEIIFLKKMEFCLLKQMGSHVQKYGLQNRE